MLLHLPGVWEEPESWELLPKGRGGPLPAVLPGDKPVCFSSDFVSSPRRTMAHMVSALVLDLPFKLHLEDVLLLFHFTALFDLISYKLLLVHSSIILAQCTYIYQAYSRTWSVNTASIFPE